jgi:hypothetical protein
MLGRNADQTALIAALAQIIGSEHERCGCIADGSFREWALATAEGGGSCED